LGVREKYNIEEKGKRRRMGNEVESKLLFRSKAEEGELSPRRRKRRDRHNPLLWSSQKRELTLEEEERVRGRGKAEPHPFQALYTFTIRKWNLQLTEGGV